MPFLCVPLQVLLLCALLSLAGNIVYLVGAAHLGGNETALLAGRLLAGAGGGADPPFFGLVASVWCCCWWLTFGVFGVFFLFG